MDVAATIAGPAPMQRAARPSFEDASSSAKDVRGVTKPDSTRAEAGLATTASPDRDLDRAAQRRDEEQQLVKRLTAEDFAAIQEQLGLRQTQVEQDAAARESQAVSLVEDEAGLSVREIPDVQDFIPEPIDLPDPPPDFSSVVADAVVTIDEYLDWVNEAGGQLR